MQKYYPDGFFTSRFNKDYIFYTCIKIHGEICMCMRIDWRRFQSYLDLLFLIKIGIKKIVF